MGMPKFDTRVQELRYRVLKEIAKHVYKGDLSVSLLDIAKAIVPGPKPSMRCCIYKERAIVDERVSLILNASSKKNDNVIKVIPIACDECPIGGYVVSDACRGCIAHRCSENCPKHAISFNNLKATIDKTKCINCGLCAKNCPYSAIENRIRPCEKACRNRAISPDPITNAAHINDEKCVQCGNCVYMCPFGAIVDDSFIIEVINLLKTNHNVYAVVAPSIAGNFTEYKLGQVITALKTLGFKDVVEAALGADLVALHEAKELSQKGKLTSSCCPSFISYIKKDYPDLVKYISSSLSPMATIAKSIKEEDPAAKIIFIGPCTAKKQEIKLPEVAPYVDSALTFEELQVLFDANELDIGKMEESQFSYSGSSFGRGFAKCGGLTSAVNKSLQEQEINFEVNGLACSGDKEIKQALYNMSKEDSTINFVEGMMCEGGCIGGPCNLTHSMRNKLFVDKYTSLGDKEIKSVETKVKKK
ncbi:MAG: monomeric [FeFe] hydrogenase [Bacilli bacterium]|jgi:[FeFe] hydrogenase (group B1/B3)